MARCSACRSRRLRRASDFWMAAMRALTDMTGSMPGMRRQTDRRKNAVQQDADAHHVEMRLRQIEKTAAVAQVSRFHGNAARCHRRAGLRCSGRTGDWRKSCRFHPIARNASSRLPAPVIFRRAICSTSGSASSQRTPKRLMPVWIFRCTGTRLPARGGDAGEFADGVRFVDADGQIMLHAPGQFGFLPFPSSSKGAVMPASRKCHGFFQCAEAEATRAFFEGDPRHVERAVAIGFVLDHGKESHVLRGRSRRITRNCAAAGPGQSRPRRAAAESFESKSIKGIRSCLTTNHAKWHEKQHGGGFHPGKSAIRS